jgi:hypothetical protein
VNGNVGAFDERHIFNQEPDHSFPLTVSGCRTFPQLPEVRSQGVDLSFLLGVEQSAIGLALTFVCRLRFFERSQLRVPVRL